MAVKTAKSSGSKYKTISAVAVTAIAVLFLVTVSLVLINTLASRRLQRDYGRPSKASESFKLDENRSRLRAERLAKSLTIPTISWEQGHQETQALLDLHKYLRQSNQHLKRVFAFYGLFVLGLKIFYIVKKKHMLQLLQIS
jgi:hypothetical protein